MATCPRVRSLTERVDRLPVLPAVVAKLLSLSPSSDNYFDEVLDVTQEDPPMAVRVIRSANAAESAPISPITDLKTAVARLGARRIGGLVTSVAVTRVFIPTTPAQRNLWIHSVEAAVAARVLTKLHGTNAVTPEEAYLAGLLHDVGRFVMFEEIPEDLQSVEDFGWNSPSSLVAAEVEVVGFDHAELGGEACRHWQLPERLVQLVRHHHEYQPAAGSRRIDAPATLRGIVQMSDFLSIALQTGRLDGLEGDELVECIERNCTHPAWQCAPVEPELVAAHLQEIREESQRLVHGLGFPG